MPCIRIAIFISGLFIYNSCFGQQDSATARIQNVPLAYITEITVKTDKYCDRISSKTKKTLEKFSRWETKIHGLLQKADPALDAKLFGPGKLTFTAMLQKLKEGVALEENYKAGYDGYRDKLTTNIKYITLKADSLGSEFINPLKKANDEIKQLEESETQTGAAEKLIRERKKELIEGAIKVLGKNRYLAKINKEAYYYAESLRNYKEIFSDPSKAEEKCLALLNKIPAFKKFVSQNSFLAKLFGNAGAPGGGGAAVPVVNGLAGRAQVAQYAQRFSVGGQAMDPVNKITGAMPGIKNKMDKILNDAKPGSQVPKFKYNSQHTKPFLKRLEYSTDIQFQSASRSFPLKAKIGFETGYKIDDRRSAGIGVGYILGLGHSPQNIKLSNEGLGFRSYIKMLLIKGFDIRGGGEWNYNFHFNKISSLKNNPLWQKAALIDLEKNYRAGGKVKGSIKILYDFLYNAHIPATQPFVFRMGYHL